MGILGITLWSEKVLDHEVLMAPNMSSQCASSEITCSSGGSLLFPVYGKKRGFIGMRT